MNELRAALELATEEELQDLTEILFRRKLNPIDYLRTPDPIQVQCQDRQDWLDQIEARFRFLAADGLTVLKGQSQQISYRQTLMRVCRYLKLKFSPSWTTNELELEIFLGLLQRMWQKLPDRDRQVLVSQIEDSLPQLSQGRKISVETIRLVLEGSAAIAVSSLIRPLLVQQVARQFAIKLAGYKLSITPLVGKGMAMGATKYALGRSVLAFASTALWIWFAADLGWRAIATNYGRIIPTIFTIAQIRLLRGDEWLPAF
ncbi:hypothetical protein L3556_02440 [Candidatus Synechococcus calcipolaris G9]|uniref:DUF3944 domain-containing protein n=1 Tax=Candidatus Synechococcus calcipolaris G9 TaxID=1497997 RepID=A0ABT6EVH3_9SYNE|nr:hypothetical protein [Candidatus Synechococcus calcipolaris]MDG2989800.1 hypothetical protein [Candidatus Synechococcus calcipolaris G9]